MMIEVKNTLKLTKEELESIVSKATGMDVKLEKWNIKAEGDYDRGNYKETLVEMTFCSGRLIEVDDKVGSIDYPKNVNIGPKAPF